MLTTPRAERRLSPKTKRAVARFLLLPSVVDDETRTDEVLVDLTLGARESLRRRYPFLKQLVAAQESAVFANPHVGPVTGNFITRRLAMYGSKFGDSLDQPRELLWYGTFVRDQFSDLAQLREGELIQLRDFSKAVIQLALAREKGEAPSIKRAENELKSAREALAEFYADGDTFDIGSSYLGIPDPREFFATPDMNREAIKAYEALTGQHSELLIVVVACMKSVYNISSLQLRDISGNKIRKPEQFERAQSLLMDYMRENIKAFSAIFSASVLKMGKEYSRLGLERETSLIDQASPQE